jgi:hypothetical protein
MLLTQRKMPAAVLIAQPADKRLALLSGKSGEMVLPLFLCRMQRLAQRAHGAFEKLQRLFI